MAGTVARGHSTNARQCVLQVILIGVSGVFGVGLLYFIFIGVRAIFRQARRIASGAGHLQSAAAWRAQYRAWPSGRCSSGVFYLFLYFLGLASRLVGRDPVRNRAGRHDLGPAAG